MEAERETEMRIERNERALHLMTSLEFQGAQEEPEGVQE